MPSDPEHKMEDLLRAYAKKRREEAEAPFDLHPATRQLLQSEAARLRPPPKAGAGSWFSHCLAWWPRLAMVAGLFVGLALVAWIFFPPAQQRPASLAKREMARDADASNAPLPARTPPAAGPAEPQLKLAEVEQRDKAGAPATLSDLASVDLSKRLEELELKGAGVVPPKPGFRNDRNLAPDAPAPRVEPARVKVTEDKIDDTVTLAYGERTTFTAGTAAAGVGAAESRQIPVPPTTAPPTTAYLFKQPALVRAEVNEGRLAEERASGLSAIAGPDRVAPDSRRPNIPLGTVAPSPTSSPDSIAASATRQPAAPVDSFARPPAAAPLRTTALNLPQPAARPGGAEAYALAETNTRFYRQQLPAVGERVRFFQQRRGVAATPAPGPALVLAEFELQENGDVVQLVDADGSVYSGKRLAPSTADASLRFRVAGTNRSLRQSVVVDAALLFEETDAVRQKVSDEAAPRPEAESLVLGRSARTALTAGAKPAATNAVVAGKPARRIVGRMRIGSTNEWPLEAVANGR